MGQFASYSHAMVAMAGFALLVLALSQISTLPKEQAGMAPGATPSGDYSNSAYRMNRAYLNGTETLATFATVTIVAILAGAAPFWINLLASLFFVSRIVHLIVHLKGIGRPHRGPRTLAYVFGWACMIVIALLGGLAAFS